MSNIRFNPLNPRHQRSYFFYAKQNYKCENIFRPQGPVGKARKENTRKGRKVKFTKLTK